MWFWKRKPKAASPQERLIFEYWDGANTRRADPLQIWYGLIGNEDIDLIEDSNLAANGQMEASQRLAHAIRQAFGVQPYEDGRGGLTDIELHELLNTFWAFVQAVKKKRGPMPMPLRYLASKPSSDESPVTTSSAGLPSNEPDLTQPSPCPSSAP